MTSEKRTSWIAQMCAAVGVVLWIGATMYFKLYPITIIHSDVFERVITLVIAALGLIAALAWDKALRHIFETLFGGKGTLLEEISYALVVTILAAFISVRLGKLFSKRREK